MRVPFYIALATCLIAICVLGTDVNAQEIQSDKNGKSGASGKGGKIGKTDKNGEGGDFVQVKRRGESNESGHISGMVQEKRRGDSNERGGVQEKQSDESGGIVQTELSDKRSSSTQKEKRRSGWSFLEEPTFRMTSLKAEQTAAQFEQARSLLELHYGISTKSVNLSQSRKPIWEGTVCRGWKFERLPSKLPELDVVAVQAGSKGYFLGYAPGDHLNGLVQTATGDLLLQVDHNDYKHREHLRPSLPQYLTVDPDKKTIGSSTPRVIILLDHSSKMEIADCPDGKSRLQYCAEQISSLIRERHKILMQWFAMGSLDGDGWAYSVFDPDGEQILKLKALAASKPSLLSNLRSQLGAYLRRRDSGDMSPYCIVVLSSAESAEDAGYENLRKMIEQCAKFMNDKDRFKLVFMPVGEDNKSAGELATQLQSYAGVAATKTFAEFKQGGLEKIVGEFVPLDAKAEQGCQPEPSELIIKPRKGSESGGK